MDNIVEYIFKLDKLTNNKIIFKSNGYDYVYNNESIHSELENIDSSENINQYIIDNNVITIYIDHMINKYLYESLIGETFENIIELNSKLNLNTINYDNINNIILENIDNSIENIISQINIDNGVYYLHLKYNKYTYYPRIKDIINHIHNILEENYNFTFIENND